jgi:hypothetical protein
MREATGDKALVLARALLSRGLAGVPPLASAESLAAEYRADNSYRTTAERIRALVRWESSKNFASGFVTGMGGLATLPVSVPLAVGASWLLQARLAGAIAVLHGHRLRNDRVRTMMLLAVLGDSAKDVLKRAGVMVGKRVTANLISTVPGRVLIRINRAVGQRLLTTGQTGIVQLTKAVPLAGGVVGGAFDAASCVATGKMADRLFAPAVLGRSRTKAANSSSRPRRSSTHTIASRSRGGQRPSTKRRTPRPPRPS